MPLEVGFFLFQEIKWVVKVPLQWPRHVGTLSPNTTAKANTNRVTCLDAARDVTSPRARGPASLGGPGYNAVVPVSVG